MKILMILTSHDQLGDSGHKTGFWLEEFASPYYVFKDANADITLASPAGGQPPLDPKSDEEDFQTDATRRFKNDAAAQQALANTVKLAEVSADEFDAVFYPGGHGPLWDLAEDSSSINLIESMVAADKPVGAVCHAPAVLKNVKNPDGSPMVKGKSVTGFSNTEEAAVQLTGVVPFLLEDELKAKGGNYTRGDDWNAHVITTANWSPVRTRPHQKKRPGRCLNCSADSSGINDQGRPVFKCPDPLVSYAILTLCWNHSHLRFGSPTAPPSRFTASPTPRAWWWCVSPMAAHGCGRR
jgi:putative intracellular protease/amidase